MSETLDLLPAFLRDVQEFKVLRDLVDFTADLCRGKARDAFDGNFIKTANADFVALYEQQFGIAQIQGLPLLERKKRVLEKLNSSPPYTIAIIRNALDGICGAGGYTFELVGAALLVRVAIISSFTIADVKNYLTRVLPANIAITVDLLYNTEATLSQFEEGHLENHTEEQLRTQLLT